MSGNYRALTRKYRPQTFDDIVSQEHVSSTLKNAISGDRLSHAYMFCGPRGVGKTTMARVLARAINQVDDTVDGEMLSQTLNIVEIDAASNNKVEDVHHLREVVRVPPQNGNYKIFIIDEVHMLSKQAFNALLKTLEEPPPYAIFIFATTEPHKILPTILSRVQRFDFRRISVEEIVARLREISTREGITIDDESLHTIARRADGALRDALGLMDQAIAFCGLTIEYRELVNALNMVGNDQLFDFTDAVANQNASEALHLVDKLLKEGMDIQEFLVSLTEHLRNMYVAAGSQRMYLVEATEETKQRYQKAAEAFSENDLLRMLHLVSEAQIRIRDVQQPRVHFEILTLKLVHMSRSVALQELLEAAEAVKKKSGNPVSGAPIRTDDPDDEPSERESEVSSDLMSGTEPDPEGQKGSQLQDQKSDHPPSAIAQKEHPREPEVQSQPSQKEDEDLSPAPNDKRSVAHQQRGDSDQVETPFASEASVEQVVESVTEKEDSDEIFEEEVLLNGYPALSTRSRVKQRSEEVTEELPKENSSEEKKKRVSGMDDLEALWGDYLSLLSRSVPRLLCHQMENVRLRELRGHELTLAVNDPSAATMVEENRTELASLLREVIGIPVRFRCIVELTERVEPQSLSPYERFREVQKKDPHLKKIVELFGAEIQY